MSNTTKLKDRLSKLGPTTKTVRVFIGVDLDLLDEYEQIKADLEEMEGPADSLAGHTGRPDLLARQAELEEQLAEYTFEFRLRGLDDKRWERLVAAHPPRQTDGKVDDRDRIGWNMSTFPAELVKATTVEPELDDDDWRDLLGDDETEGKLPGAELDKLSAAAFKLSRAPVDVPFWSAVSSSRPNSGNG